MLYPLDPKCATDPEVSVTRITLRNISVKYPLLPYAGVLRCNATNPCSGWVFDNVTVEAIPNVPDKPVYICENIINSTVINSSPLPGCFGGNSAEEEPAEITVAERLRRARLPPVGPSLRGAGSTTDWQLGDNE